MHSLHFDLNRNQIHDQVGLLPAQSFHPSRFFHLQRIVIRNPNLTNISIDF